MHLFGRKSSEVASVWYSYRDDEMPEQANEQIWNGYTEQLAQSIGGGSAAHCVSCWNEEHSEPFPAEDTSSLCKRHVQATRMTHRWRS